MRNYGLHETTEEDLASQLPAWMPKDPESGNYSLLSPIAECIDAADRDREAIDVALTPQEAPTVAQIEAVAGLVDVPPHKDESLEHYRTRVIAEFQLLTSKGTVRDLLNGISEILEIPINRLRYTEEHTVRGGYAQVGIPSKAINTVPVSTSELAQIFEDLMATSYTLNLLIVGTYTHISEADYEAGLSDPDMGYDGLDAEGNPKDTGGTYAAVLD